MVDCLLRTASCCASGDSCELGTRVTLLRLRFRLGWAPVCYAGEDGMEYRVGLKLGISGQVMDHSMFRLLLLVCP
jgi:hypothetical protein